MNYKNSIHLPVLIILSFYLISSVLNAGILMIENDGSKTFISNGKLKETGEEDGMIIEKDI